MNAYVICTYRCGYGSGCCFFQFMCGSMRKKWYQYENWINLHICTFLSYLRTYHIHIFIYPIGSCLVWSKLWLNHIPTYSQAFLIPFWMFYVLKEIPNYFFTKTWIWNELLTSSTTIRMVDKSDYISAKNSITRESWPSTLSKIIICMYIRPYVHTYICIYFQK